MDKLKVLFVCHSNMNRSPTCERRLNEILKDIGWDDRVEVQSAGTHTAYLNAFDKFSKHLTKDLFEWADMVFVMELDNERNIMKEFHKYPDLVGKVQMMGIGDTFDRDSPTLDSIIDYWFNSRFIYLLKGWFNSQE